MIELTDDPQVQQMVRDTLRNRKEQLLRNAYLAVARDEAKVSNYLALQVIETAGKLPDAAKPTQPPPGSSSAPPPVAPATSQPLNRQ